MTLFGTDGIRGVAGEFPMTPEFFLHLGKVVGKAFSSGEKPVTLVVGRDTRESGVYLQQALCAGLVSTGVIVYDAGVLTTPGVAWLVGFMNAQVGAVISASHNPYDQNGIKFLDAGGKKLDPEVEAKLEHLASSDWDKGSNESFSPGRLIDAAPLVEFYKRALLNEHPTRFLDGITMVVDAANGAASFIAPAVFSAAGAKVIPINASPDGTNINRIAGSEYARSYPHILGNLVQLYNADLACTFDGDADRVIFVDKNGDLVDGDHMLGILARDLSERGLLLERTVVFTNMRNQGLKNYFDQLQINTFETPVGDKYVVEKLVELHRQNPSTQSIGLGGEQSGHVVLLDETHFTGDGLRTALFVLNAYRRSGAASLAELAASIGKTPQVIASVYVGLKGPRYEKSTLEQKQNQLLASYPGLIRANLRYSGTEPKFRVMLEADHRWSEADLAKIAWEVGRQAQAHAGVDSADIEVMNVTRGGLYHF